MKYIPLTQHFQTVAMLYEKCADLSSQIDSLQSQITNNDGQNGQMKNEKVEKQSLIIEDLTSRVPEKINLQPQIEKRVQQKDEIEEEKQNQEKTILKIGKSIEKSNKMKVSLTCDHCNKEFQTERQYKKHQYRVRYRGQDKSKSKSQKDQSKIKEKKEKKDQQDKRESSSKKSLETFQICL
ncbi:unnamed protein product (macronuclear) [Paramecium tetraurelia]|uniref:C2H2-type domain-containing protein n=1 Tax=Paramecium tetraurelia TaxID=5888 RepID=A0CWX2_PARTE|nr:uncharacterized protein GSPATT00001492001 [Paramecium tetraurelia]CAK75289.1 unnamed protein product [Paramecium tetraurelia]|eukprot:XP_001442686.1 hypothetical protein (macronuclear) [Paramecium tetraurelia strain d4-2]